jgi:hypothetical protein
MKTQLFAPSALLLLACAGVLTPPLTRFVRRLRAILAGR